MPRDEDSVKRSITIRRVTERMVERFAKEEGLKFSRAIDTILARTLATRAKRRKKTVEGRKRRLSRQR